MRQILIMGIGNTLLSDEGIGIHALNALKDHCPDLPGIRCIDGGTLSFTLAADIETADKLIVVDAAQFGEPPGSIRCMVNEEMDHFLGTGRLGVHEVGLTDLMDIARLTGTLPQPRALIGIQPEKLDWGTKPSEKAALAIPGVVTQIISLVQTWREDEQRPPTNDPDHNHVPSIINTADTDFSEGSWRLDAYLSGDQTK